jgi:hypothetical protein
MAVDEAWHKCPALEIEDRRGGAGDRPLGNFADGPILDQNVGSGLHVKAETVDQIGLRRSIWRMAAPLGGRAGSKTPSGSVMSVGSWKVRDMGESPGSAMMTG